MSSKQNPDKVRIRLKKANKDRVLKEIMAELAGYEEAYRRAGYMGEAEYTHGILWGITKGLMICGEGYEEITDLRGYISERMTEIEIRIDKERKSNAD